MCCKKKIWEEEYDFGIQKSKNKINMCAPAILGPKTINFKIKIKIALKRRNVCGRARGNLKLIKKNWPNCKIGFCNSYFLNNIVHRLHNNIHGSNTKHVDNL